MKIAFKEDLDEFGELWHFIKGTNENYEISTEGRIFNNKHDRFLESRKNKIGYYTIQISIDGELKSLYVHRLVAQYFIDNPNNKKQVNHKDMDKSNNNIENLEWVSAKQNQIHARKNKIWNYKSNKKGVGD